MGHQSERSDRSSLDFLLDPLQVFLVEKEKLNIKEKMLPDSWWEQSRLWKQWHSYWEEWFHMPECVLTLSKWFQTCFSPYRRLGGCRDSRADRLIWICAKRKEKKKNTIYFFGLCAHKQSVNVAVRTWRLWNYCHSHLSVTCFDVWQLGTRGSCFCLYDLCVCVWNYCKSQCITVTQQGLYGTYVLFIFAAVSFSSTFFKKPDVHTSLSLGPGLKNWNSSKIQILMNHS